MLEDEFNPPLDQLSDQEVIDLLVEQYGHVQSLGVATSFAGNLHAAIRYGNLYEEPTQEELEAHQLNVTAARLLGAIIHNAHLADKLTTEQMDELTMRTRVMSDAFNVLNKRSPNIELPAALSARA